MYNSTVQVESKIKMVVFVDNQIANGTFGSLEDSTFVRIFNQIEDASDFYELAERISNWMGSELQVYSLIVMLKQAVGVNVSNVYGPLDILGRLRHQFNAQIAEKIHRGQNIEEETIAGLLMDADLTATELKIMIADVEKIFERASQFFANLLFEPTPQGIVLSNVPIPITRTDMELYRQIQMHNTDENNNLLVDLPSVVIDEMVYDDDDAIHNNDIIDSDIEMD